MKGGRICILAFLLACSSTALGKTVYQRVEGNLHFYPYQHHADVYVQLLRELAQKVSLYKEEPTDTEWPFRFRITVGPEIRLEDLYVKIIVRDPEGFECKLRDLIASESERLKNIPIRRKKDEYYKNKLEMIGAIQSGDISKAKSKLGKVWYWATSPSQVVIPCLDVGDFLSKYKSERADVVKILVDVEDKASNAPIRVQWRYWRLRRDATMRLGGFNDFRQGPLGKYAESVVKTKDLVAWYAWTDFTASFVQAYEKNEVHWMRMAQKKLTQDEVNSLWVYPLQKKGVLRQLKILEPLLGPTIVTMPKP